MATNIIDSADAALDTHLRIDEAIDSTLSELVSNTETSAMSTMQKIRALYDSATRVVEMATARGARNGLDKDVLDIIANLGEVGAYVEELPTRMRRDLDNAQSVVEEMKELSELVEAVRSISVQSQMLAINTAIQASHAGAAGATFRVMAEEMRKLALDAKQVATSIIDGLSRTRGVVEKGMAASLSRSSGELEKVANTSGSINILREKLEDMSGEHRRQLNEFAEHNGKLAEDIAEALGHIQYQDIVRQSIDRIRDAIRRRNACIREALESADGAALHGLPRQLELVLDDYVMVEGNHNRSASQQSVAGGTPKIELF